MSEERARELLAKAAPLLHDCAQGHENAANLAAQFQASTELAGGDSSRWDEQRRDRLDNAATIRALLDILPSALTRPIKGEGEVRALREALQTARDYVSDAANGVLVYRGAGRVDPVMAESDLIRIEAALKPTPDEGG